MNAQFREDYFAYYKEDWACLKGCLRLLSSHSIRIIYLGRKLQACTNKLGKLFFLNLLKMCSKRYGIEIHDFSRIGKGIKLSHAFAITVNSGVTIGENCTLFKGCTIGSIRGGEKAGVPVIGDRVVVGTNSTVVGNITIGSDVIVVSNTFVNFDVPSNSIVIGSKAIIKSKMNSTVMYL